MNKDTKHCLMCDTHIYLNQYGEWLHRFDHSPWCLNKASVATPK